MIRSIRRKMDISAVETDADVRSIMRQVAKLLMEPIFQTLSIDLYGEGIELETDSVLGIDTNLHTTATEYTIKVLN